MGRGLMGQWARAMLKGALIQRTGNCWANVGCDEEDRGGVDGGGQTSLSMASGVGGGGLMSALDPERWRAAGK